MVTPPDVVSQLALAIPMCLLYELGILVARLVSRPVEEEKALPVAVDTENAAKMDAPTEEEFDDRTEEVFRRIGK